MADPWEKHLGESRQAFHAFTHYRNMGAARSLDKAYREHCEGCAGKQKSNKRATGRWTAWFGEWHWAQRAEAFDADQDRQARESLQQEVKEAMRRHLLQARYIESLGMQKLRATPEEEWTLALALRAAELGMKWENLLLGQPTENVAVHRDKITERDNDLRHAILSDETAIELACKLADLLGQATGPDSGGPGVHGDGRALADAPAHGLAEPQAHDGGRG